MSWISSTVSSTRGVATKVPARRRRTSKPASTRAAIARPTVMRAQPNSSASIGSDGSLRPGGHAPETI